MDFRLHAIGTRKVSKSLVTTTDPELDNFAAVAHVGVASSSARVALPTANKIAAAQILGEGLEEW